MSKQIRKAGKQRPSVPSGRLIMKPLANGRAAIYIQYRWSRVIKRRIDGIECNQTDWNPNGDKDKKWLRGSYNDAARANAMLAAKLRETDTALAEYNEKHPNKMSDEVIESILDGKPLTRLDEGRDFVTFTKEQALEEYEHGNIGRSFYKNRCSQMTVFTDFLDYVYHKSAIFLGDVTPEVLNAYIKWQQEKRQNSIQTIIKGVQSIKWACQLATDLGLYDSKVNVAMQKVNLTDRGSITDDELEDGNLRHLTLEQIQQLIDHYHSTPFGRSKDYIEMFLFSFYTGLRISDVMTLTWKNVDMEKGLIRKTLVKTSAKKRPPLVIPLVGQAIDILNRWQERAVSSRFVFGMLSDDFDLNDDDAFYRRRNTVTKDINQSLSAVGDKLKFEFPDEKALTMHVARHSFAIVQLNVNKMPIDMVSQLMGHSSVEITAKTYARYLPNTLIERMGDSSLLPAI